MAFDDDVIFTKGSGKEFTYQDLLKDIYQSTSKKRNNIEGIIQKMVEQLSKSPETAALIAGVIPMYLNASIKNEEQLTKLAAIIQRSLSKTSDSDGGNNLTDEEKAEILMNFKQSGKSGNDV